jgi:hypothetical protein
MTIREVFLPVSDSCCPQCYLAVDGISFGNDVASPSHLRPCGDYVEIEDAREIVGF